MEKYEIFLIFLTADKDMKVQIFLEQPLRLFTHYEDHLFFHKNSLVVQLLNFIKVTAPIE